MRHIELNHTNIVLSLQEAAQKYWKTNWLLNKMLLSLCSSFYLLQLVFPSPLSTAGFFQFLDRTLWILTIKSDYSRHIVSFSGLKMAFFKLSLTKYHCLHKKHDYVFNYYRMSLQIFFFIKFFCTDLSWVELRWSYMEQFL